MNRRIRQHQNWALMPFGVVLSAVYPASYMRGSRFLFGYGWSHFRAMTAVTGSLIHTGVVKWPPHVHAAQKWSSWLSELRSCWCHVGCTLVK